MTSCQVFHLAIHMYTYGGRGFYLHESCFTMEPRSMGMHILVV